MTDVSYVLGPQLRGVDFDSGDENHQPNERTAMKKSDSIGEFDRGFNSVFAEISENDQLVHHLKSGFKKPTNTDKRLSPEAVAALAKEKWRQKKSRHVSFYGSVSDTGV